MARARLDSVDALRGLAIAGMIVVNNPGTWSAVYPPLRHAEWHGWTYTDTIFPFFLFVVGVSLALSLGARRAAGASAGATLGRTALRAAILVALGLLLNLAGYLALDREHFRIPGVLQRIGLCVLAAGAIHLLGGARAAALGAVALLLGYGVLLSAGSLDPEGNLPAQLDRAVFGPHVWNGVFDPEGLLATLPAIATTLLGTLAGDRLRSGPSRRAVAGLLAAGAAAVGAGLLASRLLPINKNLWTPPYALLMAGLSAITLALCIGIVDLAGVRRPFAPLFWLGRNAIAAFVLSSLTATAMLAVRVAGPDGKPRSLWTAIHRGVFARFEDPRLGSLLFALAYLALWVAVCGVLYRKRIFVKV
jgi:predicted acyltransferase